MWDKDKEEEKTLIFRIALAFSILVGSNLILVLSSALLCAYIGPAAAGSGIPEVKAYLNGIDAPNILSPRTLLVKVFFKSPHFVSYTSYHLSIILCGFGPKP